MISYCIKKVRLYGGAPFLGNFFSLYVSEAWLLGKTDFSPTKRGGFVGGFGTYRGRGCLEKRIFPLLNGEASWVGSVRIGGVVAWKNGFFPY